MYALLALGLLALIFCLILTPIFRDLALKFKLVDQPDHHRKVHARPIPRVGGVPIAISYVLALGVMTKFAPSGATIAIRHRELLFSLLPAVGLVFLVGLFDDLFGMKPWHKLIGQIVAAVFAVHMGVQIPLLNGQPGVHWIMFPLSVLWLVGCTNAFNLIDGLDGLASGVGLFATLTTLLAAILQGNWGLAAATVPLVGCLLAFLRYNFNPASIFLGDSGSLTIGFLLGCCGVIWSQKSATLLGMVAPLMAFALPLIEVGLSIGRRFLRRQPIFQPDRGHIHHRLLGFGLHPRSVALILYGVCAVAAILSLLQSSLSYHVGGLIIVTFCFLSLIAIRRLDYIEFQTASQVIRKGSILQFVQGEIHVQSFRRAMAAAESLDDAWEIISRTCREMGFCSVRMVIQGETFEDSLSGPTNDPTWQILIKFTGGGEIQLTRSRADVPSSLTSFLKLLQENVESQQEKPQVILSRVSQSLTLMGTHSSQTSKV